MKIKNKVVLICFMFIVCNAFSNNLQIKNLKIVNLNPSTLKAGLQFDISWENSWRDAINWDAAWVFFKFRKVGTNMAWSHIDLSNSGNTLSSGSTCFIPSDNKGVFIYRSNNGNGLSDFKNMVFEWDYGNSGLLSTDQIDVKIFGVEMVYVPQGSFYIGDGQSINTDLYANFEAGSTSGPFMVNSENAITLGGGSIGSLGNNNRENQFINGTSSNTFNCNNDGCLTGSGDDFDDVNTQFLPSAFPKGFNAFYCMKYEMTQQQFVDMLNCLSPQQQNSHLTATSSFYFTGTLASNRYTIALNSGVYETSTPYIPMIYCDWVKAAAYADWAALRPMSELEFEKACRGFVNPITGEYSWGNANIDLSDDFTISNYDSINEGISNGFDSGGVNGNAWVRASNQTMQNVGRVGIFAAHPSSSGRVSSGASYWGIMDLSGNAWERAVSVGNPEGRKYTAEHGDGNLDASAYANVLNWPGSFSNASVITNSGVGYRGGGLAYPNPNIEKNAQISSRRLASAYWNIVINDDGARFVRTEK